MAFFLQRRAQRAHQAQQEASLECVWLESNAHHIACRLIKSRSAQKRSPCRGQAASPEQQRDHSLVPLAHGMVQRSVALHSTRSRRASQRAATARCMSAQAPAAALHPPTSKSCTSTKLPFCSSRLTAPMWPPAAARCSAERPSELQTSTSCSGSCSRAQKQAESRFRCSQF